MPWVAGSEPTPLRTAPGMICTNLPERYGVDVLWRARGKGYCGAQRKELGDLLASVTDGRLAKEIQQMQSLEYRWLVVEGTPMWSMDGAMMGQYGKPWTRRAWNNLFRSVMADGVMVEYTHTLADTIQLVDELVAWSRGDHKSLRKRPGPVSSWGKADNRDFQLHLIQGLPGVGIDLATRILDELGMPFKLAVTREELMGVDGLGPKKVEAICQALA